MATRLRSPNYPSTPLGEAIEFVNKLFRIERTNPVDREVAAQAMGYTGISGRSAKVLSNLTQYGLLERVGKGEVRVTQRAVEILLPDDDESRAAAIYEAICEPELFKRLTERFPAGLPSEAALKSYLLKSGFADVAIPRAINAYLESYQFLEEENVIGSHGQSDDAERESQSDQDVMRRPDVRRETFPQRRRESPANSDASSVMPVGWQEDGIRVNVLIRTPEEAERIKGLIKALEPWLPQPRAEVDASKETAIEDDEDEDDGTESVL